MRRRKVILTIEAETVLTTKELKSLVSIRFDTENRHHFYLSRLARDEEHGLSHGTITQVQVNVIGPTKATKPTGSRKAKK